MIGQTISHYKILRKLGHGGMGDVYLAENTRLGLKVALKFLASELTRDPTAIQRLEHEARAVAELSHPNISRIHDIEQVNGHRFLVLEYLEGETLSDRIQRGPLPIEETIRIGKALADGLAHAHACGIVHRDIKASNVMMTSDGGIKILDFGLARVANATQLTASGEWLGTIPTMSPEQASGEPADERSDLWSVGITLYQCLTGRLPFEADSAHAVVHRIRTDRPAPPTSLRTGVPMDLDRSILRCLEKDPSLRYQSAGDLLAELRRIERGGIAALSDAPTKTLSVSASDRRTHLLRGSLFVLVSLGVALAVWRFVGQPEPSPELAKIVVLPFENLGAPEDAYFADGMTEEITSRLAQGGMRVISRTSAVRYAGSDKEMRQIGEELGVGYVLEGSVRWAKDDDGPGSIRITPQLIRVSDDTHVWTNTYENVFQDVFQIQSDVARHVLEHVGGVVRADRSDEAEAMPTDNLEAYQAYLRGVAHWNSPSATRDTDLLAIKLLERSVELDSEFALAHAKLAMVISDSYRFGTEGWESELPRAKQAAERAVALAPRSSEAHSAMALYHYWGYRDYERALAAINIAVDLNPTYGAHYETRGAILRRMGQWESAQADYERCSELDPKNASTVWLLGQSHQYLRQYEDAIRAFDIAISLAPDQRAYYLQKVQTYWAWKGGTTEARQTLQAMPFDTRPIRLYLLDFYDGHFEAALERATSLDRKDKEFFRALCLELLGRSVEAQEAYEAELERVDHELERAARGEVGELRHVLDLYRRGEVLASLGRRDEAILAGTRALELLPPSKDTFATDLTFSLVYIYMRVGEYDAACDQVEFILSHPSRYSIRSFRMSPRMAPLWELPRFAELEDRFRVE